MVAGGKSREEIRFLALLAKTNERAANLGVSSRNEGDKDSEADDEADWRLPKFIETLELWLDELKSHPQGPDKEVLKEYASRVDFLRKVWISYNDDQLLLMKKSDKKTFTDNVNAGSRRNSSVSDGRRRSFREQSPVEIHPAFGPNTSMGGHLIVPHGPATTKDTTSKEIHQRLSAMHDQQARDALFGNASDGIRNRRGGTFGDTNDGDDLDSLIKAHHADQERTAEEMLSLTRALKEHAQVANTIIKKDTDVLEKTNELAEKNSTKLNVESERLAEARSQFSCRCWIWLLVGTVSITFISMVWVMKFFRKRKDMI